MSGYWSLYNQIQGRRLDGLKTIEARAVVATFPPNDVANWLAWQEGAQDWKPLTDFPELAVSAGVMGLSAPPLPPPPQFRDESQGKGSFPKNDSSEFEFEEGTRVFQPDLTEAPAMVDKRRNTRFQKKFEVTIELNGQVFQTQTTNISLGGMKLEDPIPEWVPNQASVVLTRKGQFIKMACLVIEEPDRAPRYRMQIRSTHQLDLLRSWLLMSGVS